MRPESRRARSGRDVPSPAARRAPRARWLRRAALLLLAALSGTARAHESAGSSTAEIDAEHIYGFTEGSEIGEAGKVEIHGESFGRVGVRTGRYAAVSSDVTVLYTLTDSFRVAPVFTVDTFGIRDVPGLSNRSGAVVEGPAVELKYRVLDVRTAPFGLTFGATPFISRVDALTGVLGQVQGSTFIAILDRALVPNRVFAALNLVYGLSRARGFTPGERDDGSTLAASGGLSVQVADGLLVGGEIRHLRNYDGLGLDRSVGSALYLGPTFYAQLGEKAFVSGGLNLRLAGRESVALAAASGVAAGPAQGGAIFTGFERCQFVLRVGYEF